MSQKRKHERKIRFASQHLMRKADKVAAKLDAATNESSVEFYNTLYTDLSNDWIRANARYRNWAYKNGDNDDDWSPIDDSRNYYQYEACMSVGDYEGANDCFH